MKIYKVELNYPDTILSYKYISDNIDELEKELENTGPGTISNLIYNGGIIIWDIDTINAYIDIDFVSEDKNDLLEHIYLPGDKLYAIATIEKLRKSMRREIIINSLFI